MKKSDFHSIRRFQKARKRLPLGKDIFGKTIYPYDFVRVQIPHETSTSHCSIVHWNALDGAFLDSHPAHLAMEMGKHRSLRDYLRKTYSKETTCIKITEKEYTEWKRIRT
jgi:hypothetical protein